MILFAASLPLSALQARPGRFPDDQRIGFSVSPLFTYMEGYSDELVFDESSDPYPYLSQLTWDIKPALVLGLSTSVVYKNRFSLNLAAGTAVNKNSGEMVDRDWIEDYFDAVDTEYTHESVSDIDYTKSFLLDVNATARVFRFRWFRADLMLGYKYMTWGWTDEITSIDYPTGDYDYLEGTNGIDYDVEYSIPYFGINLEAAISRFSGGLSFSFSPFVSVEDHDYHILRGLHFYEDLSGGNYFGSSVYFRYALKEWISFSLSGDVDYVPEFKGDTEVYDENDTLLGISENAAGVEYFCYSATLAVEFNF